MPRKPRLGQEYVIEGLSDGREIRPESFVEDFTGEVMPVVQDTKPVQAVPSAQDIRLRMQRDKQARAKAMVDTLFGAKPEAEAKPPRVKGMRPVARLGEGKVIMAPVPPWRRV